MIALLPVFTDKIIIKENLPKSKNKQENRTVFPGIYMNYCMPVWTGGQFALTAEIVVTRPLCPVTFLRR